MRIREFVAVMTAAALLALASARAYGIPPVWFGAGGPAGSGEPAGPQAGDIRWSEGAVVVEASAARHDLWPAGVPGRTGWHLDSACPATYAADYDDASQLWSMGGVKLHESGQHRWGEGTVN